MKTLLSLLILLPFFSWTQGPEMSVKTKLDLHTIIKETPFLLKGESKYSEELPINFINGEIYVAFLGKIKNDINHIQEIEDVIIGKGSGTIKSIRIKIESLEKINQLSQFSQLELAGKIKPLLDKEAFDTRADSVHLGLDLPKSFTGKNVLIGIQDWGFDYTSPMFYDTLLEESRILAAWDQWKVSGAQAQSFEYGTEYSNWSELLAAQSDTSNQYGYGTHATHVAGIAGGSGAGVISKGMAFEANLLFSTIFIDEAAVIDSWYWMVEKAQEFNKNLIVNMSWGLYNMGTSDGSSLLSQAIDELSLAGVLFVSSAGNNGNANFHFQRSFANDSIKSIVGFDNYAVQDSMWGQSIHGWGEIGQNFETKIEVRLQGGGFLDETPYFSTTMNAFEEGYVVVNNEVDTVWYNVAAQEAHPQNGKPTVRFRVKNTNPNLRIVLSVRAEEGTVHFWNVIELSTNGGNWGLPFTASGSGYIAGDADYGIGEPSAATSCITVASHAAEYVNQGYLIGGGRSSFSSKGPRNDGIIKPDISAPGSNVVSSFSSFTDGSYNPTDSVSFQGKSYYFGKLSGTSMASPAAAGVCALVWEVNPYLSAMQVKDIVLQSARQDSKTGDLPLEGDVKWGHGKIDAMNAIRAALSFVGLEEYKNSAIHWSVYPNPSNTTLSIEGLDNIETIQLINMNGKRIDLDAAKSTWSIDSYASGIYIFRVVSNQRVYQKKIIIN